MATVNRAVLVVLSKRIRSSALVRASAWSVAISKKVRSVMSFAAVRLFMCSSEYSVCEGESIYFALKRQTFVSAGTHGAQTIGIAALDCKRGDRLAVVQFSSATLGIAYFEYFSFQCFTKSLAYPDTNASSNSSSLS